MEASPDRSGRSPKKLVLCCDGTWMDSDNGLPKGQGKKGKVQTPSNVTRMARAIAGKDDAKHPQIVYYQSGVGTGLSLWDHFVGGGTGLGISENIREAYSFLANNYVAGDSVFLVGFSRGAFTARSIGGLLGDLGLLQKKAMPYFPYIFYDWENAGSGKNSKYEQPSFIDHYMKATGATEKPRKLTKIANEFKEIGNYLADYKDLLRELGWIYEVPVKIKAIGVFDTVGSLGIPVNPKIAKIFSWARWIHEYKWFNTEIGNHVDYAFHALALDEHREPFTPAVWERPQGVHTHLKQVWFPGSHSNVGGSYEDTSSADITLAWMMDQLSGDHIRQEDESRWHSEDWIEFDEHYILEQYRLNNHKYKEVQQSKRPTWSLGTLYDSFTFPQSLVGYIDRTPGRYHRTYYDTGKPDQENMLLNTNEYMHASVRERMKLNGAGSIAKDGPWYYIYPIFVWLYKRISRKFDAKHYNPRALKGWNLQEGGLAGHATNGLAKGSVSTGATSQQSIGTDGTGQSPRWVWVGGNDGPPQGHQVGPMEEDRLGRFELLLLRAFGEDIAKSVEMSNAGTRNPGQRRRITRLEERSSTL